MNLAAFYVLCSCPLASFPSLAWRALLGFYGVQQHLTLAHRILFHRVPGMWISPVLEGFLTFGMHWYALEGFGGFNAGHATTAAGQMKGKCESEVSLFYSHKYMKFTDSSFLTWRYIARSLVEQTVVCAVLCFWYSRCPLEVSAAFVVAPAVFRHTFVRGHRELHKKQPAGVTGKYQNFTDSEYERQAFNFWYDWLPPPYAAVLLAFAFGGEHLHNNHHHGPTKLKQAYKENEIDGSYHVIMALHHLRLLDVSKCST
eukprot:TRINITY_DN45322_c0_g1_i1.p1 TRINITY_DN45322_c0_g1~~TRINITY_DN45322_c0_g1_i1.p1  ORF type:complete len:257 (+),score=42.21 TRINITY_DN45322_c0_g1_i1:223-993(+)